MPTRAYYESLWGGVPQGLAPQHARVREEFLLARLAEVAGRLGDVARPRVLDVGCGEGHFAAVLSRHGADPVAVDVAEEPLRRARQREPQLDFRLVDPQGPLPLEDSSFDLIWAGEVIEHVADTAGWLSELRRVLRSGGLLVITTPDHGLLRRLSLLRLSVFEQHFDPRSDHLRFYGRRVLVALLEDFGFEGVEVSRGGRSLNGDGVLLAGARRSRF
jgi:SAM-dependent methyltransferase